MEIIVVGSGTVVPRLERRQSCVVVRAGGQMLVFDGANLEHGNRINRSDETRVSFDFRVIPLSP